jgi:hypothetical protein
MNRVKHKLLSILLIIVFALSTLAGCVAKDTGGGSSITTPASSTATPEQTPSNTATPSATQSETAKATPSGQDWGELKTYVDAGMGITFKAPASWVEQLNDVQGGVSVMRLHAAGGEPNDGVSAQMEVTFWPVDEGSFAEQTKNLEPYYSDLAELPSETIHRYEWQRLTATQREGGNTSPDYVMNGYYAKFGVRNLYIQFENIPAADPLIQQVLESIIQF